LTSLILQQEATLDKKQLTRRDFLVSGALSLGAAALAGCADRDVSPSPSLTSTPLFTIVPPPTQTSIPT